MNKIEHTFKHQYQPTNTTCSPTALSMLLSFYGKSIPVQDISEKVPQVKNSGGEDSGTINQQMAVWCVSLGFKVSVFTSDVQVIDQSWGALTANEIRRRLEARMKGAIVPSIGELWTKAYCQSYIDLLDAKVELTILPAISSSLLYALLKNGPVLPCLCFNTLYGKGKSSADGKRETSADDINGRAWNHSVVIYGHDEQGNFLIADPWEKPGRHVVEPERMVAAIATAQIECDNVVFQLSY
jgi:hypothetical protein